MTKENPMRRRLLANVSTLVLLGAAVGCGAATNINQIWGGDDHGADGKILRAKLAYDRGDYSEAQSLARGLLQTNPDNEEAAILLGYTYLSLGGMDPYKLSRELVAMSAEDAAAGSFLKDDDGADSTQYLKKLSGKLLTLSDADYDVLSRGKKADGLFANSPIYLPERVNDELRGKVATLANMNQALRNVCRFVDAETIAANANRFADCQATKIVRKNSAKAHFLWAFANLTEAMIYQSVLLYSGTEAAEGKSNFEAGVDVLNNTNFEGDNALSEFANAVNDLKDQVDAVFDTNTYEDGNSMLNETLAGLRSVSASFKAMSLPAEFSKPIDEALARLDQIASKIGADGGSDKGPAALKTQITESFTKTVEEKINGVFNDQIKLDNVPAEQREAVQGKLTKSKFDTLSDQEKMLIFGGNDKADKVQENIENVCGAYDSISKGLPADSKSTPKTCT